MPQPRVELGGVRRPPLPHVQGDGVEGVDRLVVMAAPADQLGRQLPHRLAVHGVDGRLRPRLRRDAQKRSEVLGLGHAGA